MLSKYWLDIIIPFVILFIVFLLIAYFKNRKN